jgi:uncharacterized membrane protein HdeD (DUF308 family)
LIDARAGALPPRAPAFASTLRHNGVIVIILGVILLILGFIFSIHILWILGIIALVIGVILMLVGTTGRTLAGRRHWY